MEMSPPIMMSIIAVASLVLGVVVSLLVSKNRQQHSLAVQQAVHQQALQQLRQQIAELQAQQLVLENQNQNKAEQLAKLEAELSVRDQSLTASQHRATEQAAQVAALGTELEQQRES
ncbi:MAG: hypothetical protein GY712_03145, partial [Oceanicoccus sp.]|uniref:hypothetical protein n=1 Tax=Oceanicoccus sp. TaxID=2691044 RepID=UPI00262D7B85